MNYSLDFKLLQAFLFDVIDAIAKVDTDRRDRPVSDVKILSITLDEASKPAPAAAADSTEVK